MMHGVFWIIEGQLYAFPFDGSHPEAAAKSGNTYNHKKLWESVRPAGKAVPFNYYPRGRAELTNRQQPVLYMSPHIGAEWIPQIMLAFDISEMPIVRYDFSAHYRCRLDESPQERSTT